MCFFVTCCHNPFKKKSLRLNSYRGLCNLRVTQFATRAADSCSVIQTHRNHGKTGLFIPLPPNNTKNTKGVGIYDTLFRLVRVGFPSCPVLTTFSEKTLEDGAQNVASPCLW